MKISRIAFLLSSLAIVTPTLAQGVNPDNKWQASAGISWQNLGPSGTWWRTKMYIALLSLTTDQQKKMDDVFQQTRIKLIDLTAILSKEEAILEPLLQEDRLDEGKVEVQIDKVANARAELEKANARMLLGIRQILTPEQWTRLNSSQKSGLYSGFNYYKKPGKPLKD